MQGVAAVLPRGVLAKGRESESERACSRGARGGSAEQRGNGLLDVEHRTQRNTTPPPATLPYPTLSILSERRREGGGESEREHALLTLCQSYMFACDRWA